MMSQALLPMNGLREVAAAAAHVMRRAKQDSLRLDDVNKHILPINVR